jgi:soluble lytic murein transglycosylase-like protein
MMPFKIDRRAARSRTGMVLAGATLVFGLLLLFSIEWGKPPRFIPREEVWRVVEREAVRHDLEPRFVFAIVAAESSFNAHARNGDARGLMQLRPPAWQTVTEVPFRRAWRWETNVVAGTAYLGHLRLFLEERGQFSYPHLAAAYRHGPYRLQGVGFRLDELPEPRNRIYQELHRGRIDPVVPPA